MARLNATPAGPCWGDYSMDELVALSPPALAAVLLNIAACERLKLAQRPGRSRSRPAVKEQTSMARATLANVRALAKPSLPA